jgi:hypothetical protein
MTGTASFAEVQCPVCRIALPPAGGDGAAVACSGCGTVSEVWAFPGLARRIEPGALPESLGAEGEAACYYHAASRAVVPCSRCGRFLCALCDVTWGGGHVCPSCLAQAARDGGGAETVSFRFLPGQLGFVLAVAIPLLYPMTLFTWVTAPAAVVLGFLGLRRPGRLTGERRWMSWLAIILGLLQTVGWVAAGIWLTGVIQKNWESNGL